MERISLGEQYMDTQPIVDFHIFFTKLRNNFKILFALFPDH